MAAEGDPLFDTLFRPTAAVTVPTETAEPSGAFRSFPGREPRTAGRSATIGTDDAASAAPLISRGAHTRAGNAMDRTRAALLDGARLGIARQGTKVSIAAIATLAGVAKATLYNHFRTRDAILSALVADEVRRLESVAREGFAPHPAGLAAALAAVAQSVRANPVRAALAHSEPATLARIACIEPVAGVSPLWDQARAVIAELLVQAEVDGAPADPGAAWSGVGDASGSGSSRAEIAEPVSVVASPSSVELVLRWLTSFVLSPAPTPLLISAALPSALPDTTRPSDTKASSDFRAPAGFGAPSSTGPTAVMESFVSAAVESAEAESISAQAVALVSAVRLTRSPAV